MYTRLRKIDEAVDPGTRPWLLDTVIVDTTVQSKAVEHPTDARLYRKIHSAMLHIARKEGIVLRQGYRKLMEQAFRKHGGLSKAKQYGRAKRVLRSLKSMAGRIMRDVERKMSNAAFEAHKGTLILADQILTQNRFTKGMVYSLHAPEVECIAKGKGGLPSGAVPQTPGYLGDRRLSRPPRDRPEGSGSSCRTSRRLRMPRRNVRGTASG